VLNRTVARAEAIASELGAERAGPLESLAELEWDVLVNATSVGLRSDASPVVASALRANTVVFDAVYEPADTRLLRDARARGARTVGGKWMLVEQALEQIRIWTGETPPQQVLAEAFDSVR
jgi:shikimate dehydrogenase